MRDDDSIIPGLVGGDLIRPLSCSVLPEARMQTGAQCCSRLVARLGNRDLYDFAERSLLTKDMPQQVA